MLDLEIKAALDDIAGKVQETLKGVKKAQDDMSEKLTELEKKQVSGADLTDIKGRVEDSRKELETLGENVTDLTRKMSARHMEGKSLGRMIAEHKDFQSLKDDRKARFEMKDVTTGSFGNTTLPGGVRRQDRGMIMPVQQKLFLRDIIPTASTSAAVIEYLQETGFTNNAGVVAEGTQKPQSELTFAPRSSPMVKMAHFFRVTEETLDDVDGMEAYINQRGLYGLQLKEEQEVLLGNGSSGRIDGLIHNSTDYLNTTVPGVVPAHAMDDIRIAIAQVHEADLLPSGIIMNHLDAAALEMEKDADGKYLFPAFTGNTAWGLPIVATKGLPQGQFIVGGFVGNTILWQRKGIEIRRSTEDRDNFVKNLVTILLEERLQLETLRPEGIVHGTLTAAAAA